MLLFNRFEYNPNTDLIGKGAFSRVYRAIDKNVNQAVALKLHKPGPGSGHNLALSEISALSSLDHANISRYIAIDALEKEDAFGETEKIQIAVTPLAEKGNIMGYKSFYQVRSGGLIIYMKTALFTVTSNLPTSL